MSRLKVAGIQVRGEFGRPAENLVRASGFVEEAVARGAQLVVCPELLAPGYSLETSIWNFAEEPGGPTESWLASLSRSHRIYLGAGYLEKQGADYYNTFALAGPTGALLGRVRKRSFGYFESWIFKAGRSPIVIPTGIGSLGVGICFDNYRREFLEQMRSEAPDLLLMPHSSGIVPRFPGLTAAIRESLMGIAPLCSRWLGIPCLLVNRTGPAAVSTSLMGSRFVRLRMDFEGLSRITAGSGQVLAALDRQEGLVEAELDLARRSPAGAGPPPGSGFWSLPPGRWGRTLAGCHRVLHWLGERSYRRRIHRFRRRHEIQSG